MVARYSNSSFVVECNGQVAKIKNRPPGSAPAENGIRQGPGGALGLANLLDEMRADDSIRVIVLHRGGEMQGSFRERFSSPEWQAHHNDPVNIWHTFSGIIRMHEVMASIEKPIVVQVDGDIVRGATN